MVVLAGLLVALVGHALRRADQTRARWGTTTAVWVAAHPLRRGDALAGSLRREHWPTALVPEAAVGAPSAGRAATAVDAGTVLTAAMVEQGPTRRRTVAVPLADAHLPVVAGDRVDVWATVEPVVDAQGGAATRRVAADARVVSTSRGSVVLEIEPSQVPAVTEAASTSTVALVGAP